MLLHSTNLHVRMSDVSSGTDEHSEAALDAEPAAVARHLLSMLFNFFSVFFIEAAAEDARVFVDDKFYRLV